MAFGEETSTPQRIESLGYAPANGIRQGYTGYKKDIESGLEFAQARYYNSAHGRFTSVDPLTASANVKNPQTFNRYSYVLNSPYKFSDPLGLISESTGACGSRCANSDPRNFGGGMASPYGGMTVNVLWRMDQQTIDATLAPPMPTAQQNAEPGLVSIPGVEVPEQIAIYEGETTLGEIDANGQFTFNKAPDIALPQTSAVLTEFLKAISPYAQTTAVLNLVENITGKSIDTISTTEQLQIGASVAKVFGLNPSTTVTGTVTGTIGQTVTEKGASTLATRADISAAMTKITLEFQEKVKSALAADRVANEMPTLSDKALLQHTTSAMTQATNNLDATIRPRTDSVRDVLTDLLKKSPDKK